MSISVPKTPCTGLAPTPLLSQPLGSAGNPQDPLSGLLPAFQFQPKPPAGGRGTTGAGTAYHCEQFLLIDDHLPAGRYRRTAAAALADDLDVMVISFLATGRAAVFDQGWQRLRPGDVVILDLVRPTVLSVTDAHMLHLIVPRLLLPQLDKDPGVVCHHAGELAASLTANILTALVQRAPHTSKAQLRLISPSLLQLMGAALGMPGSPSMMRDTTLAHRLRRYIEYNLKSQTLTPADLARRFGVSRSQLYRTFASCGGVETYVRSRRLRHSMIALSDPNQAHRRIGEISYALGFADEAHFSRLFRAAYGCSPRAWRKAATEAPSTTGIAATGSMAEAPLATMAAWLRQMTSGQQMAGA
jgi:AraC-like DNA-binding protein